MAKSAKTTEELLGKQRNTDELRNLIKLAETNLVPTATRRLNRLSRKLLSLKRKLKIHKTCESRDWDLIVELTKLCFKDLDAKSE
jgi:hypothetical protein